MKIIVFGGAGMMGRVAAWDLAMNCSEVEAVGIADIQENELKKVKAWIGSEKVTIHTLDIENRGKVRALMAKYDVGVMSLNQGKTTYALLETAIEEGFNIADVGGEYYRKPGFMDFIEQKGVKISRPDDMTLDDYGEMLHEKAVQNGVTIVMGMGFSPGLTNITCAEGINKMDKAEKAIARCGGFPTKDCAHKYPMNYYILFNPNVIDKLLAYNFKGFMIKNGKLVNVSFYDELETINFTKLGHDEVFEAYMTPSMPSFPHTRLSVVNEFYEKTLRWPGYVQGMKTLKECGLTDFVPIEIKPGEFVSPIELLGSIMKKKWLAKPGDNDVSILWDTVIGTREGTKTRIDYYMWEEGDQENSITAMARMTAFPVSITAVMLGKGEITKKGLLAPEDAIEGQLYQKMVEELAKRDITILEEITNIE
ncbi:MAG: saccharopine dehydrogenase family protein [Candidatus Hodarchaeales archaeon]|jgi:saccharopine dehydrogenase-like NADP-dependent oxidoreductase